MGAEFKKVRAHTRYRVDDVIVPGVTTILGVLNKPALIPWANKMGLQGIDTNKFVNAAARVGTLAHEMAECDLGGPEPDFDAYSPHEKDRAENALLSFYEWRKHHKIEPLLIEERLVSKQFRFGGTIDCYGIIDGDLGLVDLKTGKAIYPEMFHQLAAYCQLLEENGKDVKSVRILRIGREEGEGFEERVVTRNQLVPHWEIFTHCLKIYTLQKTI